jgi:hypothetical protein
MRVWLLCFFSKNISYTTSLLINYKKTMASNQQQYDEQLQLLQELYPEESKHKILRLLKKYNGDFDQVSFFLNL